MRHSNRAFAVLSLIILLGVLCVMPAAAEHTHSWQLRSDVNGHWYACECGAVTVSIPHGSYGGVECAVCGWAEKDCYTFGDHTSNIKTLVDYAPEAGTFYTPCIECDEDVLVCTGHVFACNNVLEYNKGDINYRAKCSKCKAYQFYNNMDGAIITHVDGDGNGICDGCGISIGVDAEYDLTKTEKALTGSTKTVLGNIANVVVEGESQEYETDYSLALECVSKPENCETDITENAEFIKNDGGIDIAVGSIDCAGSYTFKLTVSQVGGGYSFDEEWTVELVDDCVAPDFDVNIEYNDILMGVNDTITVPAPVIRNASEMDMPYEFDLVCDDGMIDAYFDGENDCFVLTSDETVFKDLEVRLVCVVGGARSFDAAEFKLSVIRNDDHAYDDGELCFEKYFDFVKIPLLGDFSDGLELGLISNVLFEGEAFEYNVTAVYDSDNPDSYAEAVFDGDVYRIMLYGINDADAGGQAVDITVGVTDKTEYTFTYPIELQPVGSEGFVLPQYDIDGWEYSGGFDVNVGSTTYITLPMMTNAGSNDVFSLVLDCDEYYANVYTITDESDEHCGEIAIEGCENGYVTAKLCHYAANMTIGEPLTKVKIKVGEPSYNNAYFSYKCSCQEALIEMTCDDVVFAGIYDIYYDGEPVDLDSIECEVEFDDIDQGSVDARRADYLDGFEMVMVNGCELNEGNYDYTVKLTYIGGYDGYTETEIELSLPVINIDGCKPSPVFDSSDIYDGAIIDVSSAPYEFTWPEIDFDEIPESVRGLFEVRTYFDDNTLLSFDGESPSLDLANDGTGQITFVIGAQSNEYIETKVTVYLVKNASADDIYITAVLENEVYALIPEDDVGIFISDVANVYCKGFPVDIDGYEVTLESELDCALEYVKWPDDACGTIYMSNIDESESDIDTVVYVTITSGNCSTTKAIHVHLFKDVPKLPLVAPLDSYSGQNCFVYEGETASWPLPELYNADGSECVWEVSWYVEPTDEIACVYQEDDMLTVEGFDHDRAVCVIYAEINGCSVPVGSFNIIVMTEVETPSDYDDIDTDLLYYINEPGMIPIAANEWDSAFIGGLDNVIYKGEYQYPNDDYSMDIAVYDGDEVIFDNASIEAFTVNDGRGTDFRVNDFDTAGEYTVKLTVNDNGERYSFEKEWTVSVVDSWLEPNLSGIPDGQLLPLETGSMQAFDIAVDGGFTEGMSYRIEIEGENESVWIDREGDFENLYNDWAGSIVVCAGDLPGNAAVDVYVSLCNGSRRYLAGRFYVMAIAPDTDPADQPDPRLTFEISHGDTYPIIESSSQIFIAEAYDICWCSEPVSLEDCTAEITLIGTSNNDLVLDFETNDESVEFIAYDVYENDECEFEIKISYNGSFATDTFTCAFTDDYAMPSLDNWEHDETVILDVNESVTFDMPEFDEPNELFVIAYNYEGAISVQKNEDKLTVTGLEDGMGVISFFADSPSGRPISELACVKFIVGDVEAFEFESRINAKAITDGNACEIQLIDGWDIYYLGMFMDPYDPEDPMYGINVEFEDEGLNEFVDIRYQDDGQFFVTLKNAALEKGVYDYTLTFTYLGEAIGDLTASSFDYSIEIFDLDDYSRPAFDPEIPEIIDVNVYNGDDDLYTLSFSPLTGGSPEGIEYTIDVKCYDNGAISVDNVDGAFVIKGLKKSTSILEFAVRSFGCEMETIPVTVRVNGGDTSANPYIECDMALRSEIVSSDEAADVYVGKMSGFKYDGSSISMSGGTADFDVLVEFDDGAAMVKDISVRPVGDGFEIWFEDVALAPGKYAYTVTIEMLNGAKPGFETKTFDLSFYVLDYDTAIKPEGTSIGDNNVYNIKYHGDPLAITMPDLTWSEGKGSDLYVIDWNCPSTDISVIEEDGSLIIPPDKVGSFEIELLADSLSGQVIKVGSIFVNIADDIVITKQPEDIFAPYGGKIVLSPEISGDASVCTFKWYKSNGDEFVPIENGDSLDYSIDEAVLADSGSYKLIITNVDDSTVGSEAVTVTVSEYAYTENDDGGLTLTSYYDTVNSIALTLPESINGKNITAIAADAFGENIASVDMTECVYLNEIAADAFSEDTIVCCSDDITDTVNIWATENGYKLHDYDEGTVITEPDCVNNGTMEYKCKLCSATRTEEITATGKHTEDEGTITKQPTCTEAGMKTYNCTVCKAELRIEEIAATGHTTDNGTITKQPTCTESGTKTYNCTVCKAELRTKEIAATGHTSDNGIVTKEPTCTEAGTKTYACTVCKAILKTEELAATGHTSDNGTVTKEPTCTEAGIKTYTCTVCKAVLKTENIPANGHVFDNGTVTVKPTCTKSGEKVYKCSECDIVLKTESIPAAGHKWDNGSITKQPTVLEDGEIMYTCTVCEATKIETLKYTPKPKQPISKVNLTVEDSTMYLVKNETVTRKIEVAFDPVDADIASVAFKSSKKKIAKVDSSGNITALKEGKSKITVTVKDKTGKSVKASVDITVKKNLVKKIKLDSKSVTIKIGDTYTPDVTLKPAKPIFDTKLKWSSSNKKVAKVDKFGVITALKKGKAVITVKSTNGKSAKLTVKVVK